MNNKLSVWLANELTTRGWSNRELARRAHIAHTTIGDVLSGQTPPTYDFCVSIAGPLGLKDPGPILRMAGLLPAFPPPVEEETEILAILRTLAPEGRLFILRMLRGLTGATSASLSLSEAPANYQIPSRPVIDVETLDCELQAFTKDFPELEELISEARTRLSEPALRALMINVRVFAEAADRMSFAEFHRQLSEFFAEESAQESAA